jgi:hypothetical protein
MQRSMLVSWVGVAFDHLQVGTLAMRCHAHAFFNSDSSLHP